MSETAIIESSQSVDSRHLEDGKAKPSLGMGAVWVMLMVFGVQFTFANWINGLGYLWGDAVSRSTSAMVALYSADPHLAAIGFVWMPLPTLIELIPASIYPLWPEVVSSGFASSIVTVLAGTLTAGIIFVTASKLRLSKKLSAALTFLVSFSPMILLFSTNGMSEGVAAPFLIGSVCLLLLFWDGGQRRYVAAAAMLLALAFACLYQAVHFGGGLFIALVLGVFASENVLSAPQGKWRAVEGLTILFLVPSAYVGLLWMTANAAIMGDPLYFATSIYSNEGFIASSGADRISNSVRGDALGALGFTAIRTAPFAIPLLFILVVRAMEGRLFRINTLALIAISLAVPLGLIAPQLYGGQSFGWLRYFVYPLFVAAGWGMYEIAKSHRRRVASALIVTSWLLVFPASLWAMSDERYGQNESVIVNGLLKGEAASQTSHPAYFQDVVPVARTLDAIEPGSLVVVDSSNAWPVEATVSPETLKENIVPTSDERFYDALRDPQRHGVEYLLVPNPEFAPQDLVAEEYPDLWSGDESGFTLEEDFSETGLDWKLYRVVTEQ